MKAGTSKRARAKTTQTKAKKKTTASSSSKKTSSKKTSSKKASAKKASPKKASPKKASSKAPPKKRAKVGGIVERLCRQARALGVKTGIVMPIDEIRLGFKLSQQPRKTAVPSLLDLAGDGNMHARRVAVTALRRLEAWDDPAVHACFVQALEDPAGWVRYDAAWGLGESGTKDPHALAALAKLAEGALDNPPLSDGDERAKKQAKDSLAQLSAGANLNGSTPYLERSRPLGG